MGKNAKVLNSVFADRQAYGSIIAGIEPITFSVFWGNTRRSSCIALLHSSSKNDGLILYRAIEKAPGYGFTVKQG
ncbi:MAG: hypothetical protein BGP14_10635 [Sphingobacteriales bacterium 44-15]|nr:MAG: hypothetical protein BGP14_10635 [Sphingobacteriales bacterium 44-15]